MSLNITAMSRRLYDLTKVHSFSVEVLVVSLRNTPS